MISATKRPGAFLVVGSDSELGSAILDHLAVEGRAAVGTTRRKENLGPDRVWLDLENFDDSWAAPTGTTAACICAARSRLADCAADPSGTWSVNVEHTARIVKRLSELGIYSLFLSSNQVFDGQRPLVPPHAGVSPVSEYGRQKAAAEVRVLASASEGRCAVLRLSRVVGPNTPTFARWASAVVRDEQITAFSDMVLAPLGIDLVAEVISHLLCDAATGTFQLSGPEDVSYADFARAFVASLGCRPELVGEMSALSAGLPPGSAPLHTTLDSTELLERYGTHIPSPLSTATMLAAHLAEQVPNEPARGS